MSISEIYISGPLTSVNSVESIKEFYESIGCVCGEFGLNAYIPHLNTDPVNNPEITPFEVYQTDKSRVLASDLVIAYIGHPSIGVGMELAYADIAEIPVVLLYEQNRVISRFPRGLPNKIGEIIFFDFNEALIKLKDFFSKQQ